MRGRKKGKTNPTDRGRERRPKLKTRGRKRVGKKKKLLIDRKRRKKKKKTHRSFKRPVAQTPVKREGAFKHVWEKKRGWGRKQNTTR